MKCNLSRAGCAAVCLAISLALGGCAALPAASDVPGTSGSTAASVPTDSDGKPLYDSTLLQDGRLRALYSYDGVGSTTVLHGSEVLYQSASSENVALLEDTVTGETNYWTRSWSDPTGRGGRRTALYDAAGTEVMVFDGEQSATLQNGLLVLQETALVDGEYQDAYSYGTCQVLDLSTGESLPVPEGAYGCVVSGDVLLFQCYARPADLPADEWDEDSSQHSWVILQQKDGTQLQRFDAAMVMNLYAVHDLPAEWVELDDYSTGSTRSSQTLYNPVTGEALPDFIQTCGSGSACFATSDGRYQLVDMTSADRTVLGTFDDRVTTYFPGYAVTSNYDGWNSDTANTLYDLASGEQTPLYDVNTTTGSVAVYAADGALRVYDSSTGAVLTDTTVEPIQQQKKARISNEGDGYVWLELWDNDNYETTATRVYGPEGLVSDLTRLQDTYSYLNYLTTTPEGKPLFYGTRDAVGSAYGTVSDVLDADGNVVIPGLGSCYGYYSNSLNGLPEHTFAASRGFYYGWMDTAGNWIYCQSIFTTVNADDDSNYGV